MTADIDASVLLDDTAMKAFLNHAHAEGLLPRLPHPLDFAKRSAMLLLKDKAHGVPIAKNSI
ncbi:MAG: hypothetical protein ACREJU_14055 [Nitrospiraceae bacterium]